MYIYIFWDNSANNGFTHLGHIIEVYDIDASTKDVQMAMMQLASNDLFKNNPGCLQGFMESLMATAKTNVPEAVTTPAPNKRSMEDGSGLANGADQKDSTVASYKKFWTKFKRVDGDSGSSQRVPATGAEAIEETPKEEEAKEEKVNMPEPAEAEVAKEKHVKMAAKEEAVKKTELVKEEKEKKAEPAPAKEENEKKAEEAKDGDVKKTELAKEDLNEKKAEPAPAKEENEKKAEEAKDVDVKKTELAKEDNEKKAEPAPAKEENEKKAEEAKDGDVKKTELAKEDNEKKAEPAKEENEKKAEEAKDGDVKKTELAKEDNEKKAEPAPAKEENEKKAEEAKDGDVKKTEVAKEDKVKKAEEVKTKVPLLEDQTKKLANEEQHKPEPINEKTAEEKYADEFERDLNMMVRGGQDGVKKPVKEHVFAPTADDVRAALMRKTTVDLERERAAKVPAAVPEVPAGYTMKLMLVGGKPTHVLIPRDQTAVEPSLVPSSTPGPEVHTPATVAPAENEAEPAASGSRPEDADVLEVRVAKGDRALKNSYMRFHRSIHSILTSQFTISQHTCIDMNTYIYIYIFKDIYIFIFL